MKKNILCRLTTQGVELPAGSNLSPEDEMQILSLEKEIAPNEIVTVFKSGTGLTFEREEHWTEDNGLEFTRRQDGSTRMAIGDKYWRVFRARGKADFEREFPGEPCPFDDDAQFEQIKERHKMEVTAECRRAGIRVS
jgi:hypothetical protein